MKKYNSLIRGRYFARSNIPYYLLSTSDFFLKIIRFKENPPLPNNIKTVLLSNISHIGDILISITVIPLIKYYIPQAKIGFLCGEWNTEVLENINGIDYIHKLNHWRLNRKNINLLSKIYDYFYTINKTKKEIDNLRYDIAVDLYPFFPNTSLFLYKTKIPFRIGFFSGGLGELYSRALYFHPEKSLFKNYILLMNNLISELDIEINTSFENIIRNYNFFKKDNEYIFSKFELKKKSYIVIHPCSSGKNKMLSFEFWIYLIKNIIKHYNIKIILTGKGSNDEFYNVKIKNEFKRENKILDLTSQLSLNDMITLIKNSKILISVDSFPSHISSFFNTPTILLLNGINNKELWKPLNQNLILFYPNLKCAPCYLKNGCIDMKCLEYNERILDILNAIENCIKI